MTQYYVYILASRRNGFAGCGSTRTILSKGSRRNTASTASFGMRLRRLRQPRLVWGCGDSDSRHRSREAAEEMETSMEAAALRGGESYVERLERWSGGL